MINNFFQIPSFVLLSIISILHGLISHFPIVCGFISFAIAKAARQDASNLTCLLKVALK